MVVLKKTLDTDFQILNVILSVFSSPNFIPFQYIGLWCLVPFPLDLPEVTIMHRRSSQACSIGSLHLCLRAFSTIQELPHGGSNLKMQEN